MFVQFVLILNHILKEKLKIINIKLRLEFFYYRKGNMKKYLDNYIKEIDKILNSNKKYDFSKLKQEHLIKINFFQHERKIHLLVTLFYSLFLIIFLALISISYIFVFIAIILLVFVLCYIIHYFHLENGVQYLYKQYDKICAKIDKK